MKGKARCPHCKESVVVDVPDGSSGEQITTCPNCGMNFRVNVDERYSWESEAPMIHPSVHLKTRSMKPVIAGIILVILFLSGIFVSGILLFSFDSLSDINVPSEFEGKVVDDGGNALEGISVTVVGHPGMHAVTDSNGKFLIRNITSGKQKLLFTGEGYGPLTAEVFVLPWNITFPYERFEMKKGEQTEQKSLIIRIFELGPLMSAFIIAMSVAALAGGIAAITRKHFIIALIGAVLGTISGIFTLAGIVLGIIAIVLLLISKDEFETEPREMKY